MTPQELLQPRRKVIAPYPSMPFSLGQVLNLIQKRNGDLVYEWAEHDGIYEMSALEFDEYPHLFKKLEWWEERKPEDMPEYVKTHAGGSVRTVKGFLLGLGKIILDGGKYRAIRHWIPATKEEYEAFINQKATGGQL